jgi:pterin-4a-carbinolamine dehydratase
MSRRLEGDSLVWDLRFRDFDEGLRFVERMAEGAVDYGRRPDACIWSNRVRLSITNPHHAGFTRAEMRLAAKVDAVISEHAPKASA